MCLIAFITLLCETMCLRILSLKKNRYFKKKTHIGLDFCVCYFEIKDKSLIK